MKNTNNNTAYKRAMNRVEKLRGFYIHALVYVVVNLFVSIFKVLRNINNGESFDQAFFDFNTFILWLFWGIGLTLHAFSVFGLPLFLGQDWEERKIEEFMNDDRSSDRT
ncbi:MAG: 2TM domain-containing protein [Flavobacteriaceae bacterium]|nr:2TM domain-containing protein [Bacteroidia bacterium]MBT8288455.1 2TM domain-containing protein [Bacteroidia bacterium]NNF75873.1 2TM domain-containing protein [Flavobacteriaceae bacterium]NNK72035.1 2TM domain-containing protein [Flavobacteriaceae bacterium]